MKFTPGGPDDPGPVPAELQYGVLDNEAADNLLADMLSKQHPELVKKAVEVANWAVFERQSANPLYYKRAVKKARVSLDQQAAYFRRRVWGFIYESPLTRARLAAKEAA